MKKIGIITMNGNNFGNRLQNYALQEYLKKLGMNVETIYNCVYEVHKENKFISSLKSLYFKIKKTIINKKLKKINHKKNQLFDKFNKEFIKFSSEKVDNNYVLSRLESLYDYFIVGSDQVWNPYAYRNKDIDFLNFSPKEKNLTYAVSFGIEKLEPKFEEIYKKGLENFNYISVRENQGVIIAQELTERDDIELSIDPTMLFDNEEWQKIEKKPDLLLEQKYILNYFLGELSKERQNEIERIAKENNCKIINILDSNDPFYVSGPSEFIYLERNAFLICTDSFHACVFAILFKTPFIVFNREDKSASMNSRIDTLLKKFHLEKQYYNNKIDDNLLKIDYSNIDFLLEKERKKSTDYLKKALNIKEN